MRTYRDSFQYKVVTGRFTLSVAVLTALLLWGVTCEVREGFPAWIACVVIAYLLIEMTTRFSLVHARSTFPSSLYLLYCSAFPFLHVADIRCVVPVLFLCMMVGLLRSYESLHAPLFVFHTFFCLGLLGDTLLYMFPAGHLPAAVVFPFVHGAHVLCRVVGAGASLLAVWGLLCLYG